MITFTIENQKQQFANTRIYFHEFDDSEAGFYIKFCVYFHPVG